MNSFIDSMLDWIYKKKCYFCGKSSESVKMCSSCYDDMDFLDFSVNRSFKDVPIFCAGLYSKNLQKMIRGLKYHNQKELAYYQAKFMFQYWQNLGLKGDFQVVPVPIYYKRLKKRKYNHMELVANEFVKFFQAGDGSYCVNNSLIARIKDTRPQYKLNKSQRMMNLENAFEVYKENYIRGKRILIIDDICTTGSTFEEMIKALNNCGLYDIICFATTTPFD